MIRKLHLSCLVLLASTQLVGMQQQLQRPSLTPREVITGTLIAGLTLEGVYLLAQDGRYKYVGKFIVEHPGLAICGAGALLGTGMIFKDPARKLIVGLADIVR